MAVHSTVFDPHLLILTMRKPALTPLLSCEGHQVFFVRTLFGLFLQVSQQVVSLKRSCWSFLCLVLLPHPSRQQCILDK